MYGLSVNQRLIEGIDGHSTTDAFSTHTIQHHLYVITQIRIQVELTELLITCNDVESDKLI